MPAPEPMIKLDPNGQAPVLSYNVPEPTAYSGKQFIELTMDGMDASWFKPIINPASTSPTGRPPGQFLPQGGFPSTNALLSYQNTAVSQQVAPYLAPAQDLAAGTVAPKLLALTFADVQRMAMAGVQPVVYRSSITGQITYQLIKDPKPGDPYPDPPHDPPGGLFGVSVLQPKKGDKISGPAGGASVVVRGRVWVDDITDIASVDVSVDGGAAEQAVPALPGGSLRDWTITKVGLAAGRHVVTAVARRANASPKTAVSSFTVELTAPAEAPIGLEITTPQSGAIVARHEGNFVIPIQGAASPANLASLKLRLDGDPRTEIDAQPNAPGDFSTWKASVNITTEGAHRITVRATAAEGNSVEQSVDITTTRAELINPATPRIMLVESVRLSSFLGMYGAGRVVRTFSLLPGEKTKISVRTFTKKTEDRTASSSILDSVDTSSSEDFENSVSQEQANDQKYSDSFAYKVGLEGSASYGVASAKFDASVSGGTNSARQEMAKNVINATNKHSNRRSAKRDVQVNTSYDEKVETGEETSFERSIENVNVSRTLNFVFRQMNQEFVTVLHLTDVRVAYVRDDVNSEGQSRPLYKETSLSQLDAFLADVIMPDYLDRIREAILFQLNNVWDYQDNYHSFVEKKQFNGPDGNPVPYSEYWRVRKPFVMTYTHPTTGWTFPVEGIILGVTHNVMRTEGIIVDALLGGGEALDAYSIGLQQQTVEARRVENVRALAEADTIRVGNKIVQEGDKARAAVFAQVFPCCPDVVCGNANAGQPGSQLPAGGDMGSGRDGPPPSEGEPDAAPAAARMTARQKRALARKKTLAPKKL